MEGFVGEFVFVFAGFIAGCMAGLLPGIGVLATLTIVFPLLMGANVTELILFYMLNNQLNLRVFLSLRNLRKFLDCPLP